MSFDLATGEDLRQILDAAQSLLESHYPLDRPPGGTEPMTPLAEFGAFALALPETDGRAGFSVIEEAHLHAALGRHLLGPSALATPLAVRIALEAGRDDLAMAVAGGEIPVTAGIAMPEGWLLFDAAADWALIRDGAGLMLATLEGRATQPVPAMGHGRPLLRIADTGGSNLAASPQTTLTAALLTCAQLLGVAQGAQALAVDYAQTREQFGRPIGSFQAIKHHCANMAIGAEMISAQLDMAAIALRDARDDAPFQVAALARLAPRLALDTARQGIQIHGGIGFSAEAQAHLFLKQAHLLRQLLPAPDLMPLPAPMAPTGKDPS